MQGFRPKQGVYGGGGFTPKRTKMKRVKQIKRVIDPTAPRNLSFVNLSNDEINFISSLKIDLI